MPIYCYGCSNCGATASHMRRMRDCRKPIRCSCGRPMRRLYRAERVGSPNQNWSETVFSDSMGVAPSQVAAHRKAHPNIPMNAEGQIIVRNGAEERRIIRELRGSLGLS